MSALSLRVRFPGRDIRGPRLTGFGFVFDRFARHWRDSNQVIAAGTLDLPARMLFVTGKMLFAMGTLEFQFLHKISPFYCMKLFCSRFLCSGHLLFQAADLGANGFGHTMFDLIDQV
jgi:hypothetical protein